MAKQGQLHNHCYAADLAIHRAKSLRNVMLSCVACHSLPNFYTLVQNPDIFQKN